MSIDAREQPDQAEEKLIILKENYLKLIQSFLTGSIFRDKSKAPFGRNIFDPDARKIGIDWPAHALTMIGEQRLENLRALTESVLADNVPGDFIETGVWRGGACILMRAILFANGVTDRTVWLADSFQGLPPGNGELYPADADSDFHTYPELAVSLEEVKNNFKVFGLLDEQVQFLKGWFKDTLPAAPIEKFALLRLDGDMYESTMDALTALYPKLSDGGYVIIDEYHRVPACNSAVTDYCRSNNINHEIVEIDGEGVYWRKITEDKSYYTIEKDRALTNVITPEILNQHLSNSMIQLQTQVIDRLYQSLSEKDFELDMLNLVSASQNEDSSEYNQQIQLIDQKIKRLNQAFSEKQSEVNRLIQKLADKDLESAKLLQVLAERNQEFDKLLKAFENKDQESNKLKTAYMERNQEVNRLSQVFSEKEQEVDRLKNAYIERNQEVNRLNEALVQQNECIASLEEHIRVIHDSLSMKITKPLRLLKKYFILN